MQGAETVYALAAKSSAMAVIAVWLLVFTPPVSATTTCTGIPGFVSVGDLTITPSEPVVGDDVVIHFETTVSVYSFQGFTLRGTAPLFDGETTATQSATFHLHAVRAGETLVSLATTYGTEDQCVDEDTGSVYFQEGATITAGSQ